MGAGTVAATASESSAFVSHLPTNSTRAGMRPPVHARRTEVLLWPWSGPLTTGAAKANARPANEWRWIEVAIWLTPIPHFRDEDQNCCMLRSVGRPPHQRPLAER